MSRLLDDLLVIASATDLAGIDSEKTSALAASVFYTLRVTPSVMASMKKRALIWVIDLVDCMSPRTDSSKVSLLIMAICWDGALTVFSGHPSFVIYLSLRLSPRHD